MFKNLLGAGLSLLILVVMEPIFEVLGTSIGKVILGLLGANFGAQF